MQTFGSPSHLSVTLPPLPYFLSIFTPFCCFALFSNLLGLIVMEFFIGAWATFQWRYHWGKMTPPSPATINCEWLLREGWDLWVLPPSMACWRAPPSTGLVQVSVAVMTSWVSWPRHVQKSISQHPFPSASSVIPSVLSWDGPRGLGGWDMLIEASLNTCIKWSLVSAFWLLLRLCRSSCPLQPEASLTKAENSTNLNV